MREFEVTIETKNGSRTERVPEHTTLETLAKCVQDDYADKIVLASVDGRLRELGKTVQAPCKVSFLTLTQQDGSRTYRRSVTLLMQKAVENVWNGTVRVRVYWSLGEGYFCKLKGAENDEASLTLLRAEMLRLFQLDLPIKKCSMGTEEAERMFAECGMRDKERLLHYRRSSRVNI